MKLFCKHGWAVVGFNKRQGGLGLLCAFCGKTSWKTLKFSDTDEPTLRMVAEANGWLWEVPEGSLDKRRLPMYT